MSAAAVFEHRSLNGSEKWAGRDCADFVRRDGATSVEIHASRAIVPRGGAISGVVVGTRMSMRASDASTLASRPCAAADDAATASAAIEQAMTPKSDRTRNRNEGMRHSTGRGQIRYIGAQPA
jgi:hypothetical protein